MQHVSTRRYLVEYGYTWSARLRFRLIFFLIMRINRAKLTQKFVLGMQISKRMYVVSTSNSWSLGGLVENKGKDNSAA